MKRRFVNEKLIDHRDANAKVFVWFVDGEKRTLYGLGRLARENGISYPTFRGRWAKAGKPDEVTPDMLTDPMESYSMGRKAEAVPVETVPVEAVKEQPAPVKRTNAGSKQYCFLLLPDNTYHAASELKEMFGVCQTTLASRKKRGNTTVTREWLEQWSLTEKKDVRIKKVLKEEAPARPMNINDVIYAPSSMERALLGLR